jgi:hypothetical protein
MALTNSRLAVGSWALSAGGTSGASMVALSYALSAPNDFWGNNTFVIGLTNNSTTAPLLIEMRTVWTGLNGVSCTAPMMITTASNIQSYGNSGVEPKTAYLLASGKGGLLPFTGVVASTIQCIIMAASTTADAAGASGSITLWRAM